MPTNLRSACVDSELGYLSHLPEKFIPTAAPASRNLAGTRLSGVPPLSIPSSGIVSPLKRNGFQFTCTLRPESAIALLRLT